MGRCDSKSEHLDLTGLCCPLPLIRLQQTMRGLCGDAVIRVTADDPGFAGDLRDYCESAGHGLIDLKRDEDCWQAWVVKDATAVSFGSSGGDR